MGSNLFFAGIGSITGGLIVIVALMFHKFPDYKVKKNWILSITSIIIGSVLVALDQRKFMPTFASGLNTDQIENILSILFWTSGLIYLVHIRKNRQAFKKKFEKHSRRKTSYDVYNMILSPHLVVLWAIFLFSSVFDLVARNLITNKNVYFVLEFTVSLIVILSAGITIYKMFKKYKRKQKK